MDSSRGTILDRVVKASGKRVFDQDWNEMRVEP